MKKRAIVTLIGLTSIAISGFASVLSVFPPLPTPGVSCKTTYPPSSNLQNYCGCYQESAVKQCGDLARHGYAPARTCTGSFKALVTLTCATEGMRGIQSFCKTNVNNLHQSGEPATTLQNCIDDVGYICDDGGESTCSPYWA